MERINKRKLGAQKENDVREYLEKNGFIIKTMNYRCRYGEIDIVAEEEGTTAFIEVKYRSSIKYGYPEEAVTLSKQNTIRQVAKFYMMEHHMGYDADVRFDVAAVLIDEIRLIRNAF